MAAGAQVFVVDVEEDTPLFTNTAIQRTEQATERELSCTCADALRAPTGKLRVDARRKVLSALAAEGARARLASSGLAALTVVFVPCAQDELSGWMPRRAEAWCTGALQLAGLSRFTPGCARLAAVRSSRQPARRSEGRFALQVKENGLQDAVVTLDELAQGEDTKHAGASAAAVRPSVLLCVDTVAGLCTRFVLQRSMASIPTRSCARCVTWRLKAAQSASAAHACSALLRSRLPAVLQAIQRRHRRRPGREILHQVGSRACVTLRRRGAGQALRPTARAARTRWSMHAQSLGPPHALRLFVLGAAPLRTGRAPYSTAVWVRARC